MRKRAIVTLRTNLLFLDQLAKFSSVSPQLPSSVLRRVMVVRTALQIMCTGFLLTLLCLKDGQVEELTRIFACWRRGCICSNANRDRATFLGVRWNLCVRWFGDWLPSFILLFLRTSTFWRAFRSIYTCVDRWFEFFWFQSTMATLKIWWMAPRLSHLLLMFVLETSLFVLWFWRWWNVRCRWFCRRRSAFKRAVVVGTEARLAFGSRLCTLQSAVS